MAEDQLADYRIGALERRASDVQKAGLLTSARDALEDVDATLAMLPARLEEVRTRGYVYQSYLEAHATALASKWPPVRASAEREIGQRSRELQPELGRLEVTLRRLGPYRGRPLSIAERAIGQAETELSSIERRVRAAGEAVEAMFDSLRREAKELQAQVNQCLEMLDWMDQASFAFQVGETGVLAAKAQWLQDGKKEGPKGIVFLTDHRFIFEQREKVARKKFLFVTTESEEVKELLWDAPLGALAKSGASEQRKALILKKERLTLEFKHPSPVRQVELELEMDSEIWQAMIHRLLSGDLEQERVGEAAVPAAEGVTRDLPSKCPSCGATLDVTVVKGMSAIVCRFCGTQIPLA